MQLDAVHEEFAVVHASLKAPPWVTGGGGLQSAARTDLPPLRREAEHTHYKMLPIR